MRIAICATASHAIGFGHVARVVAIYDEAIARGLAVDAHFTGDAATWAAARGIPIATPSANADYDIAIVDGPVTSVAPPRARRIVTIDDRGTDRALDIVVNHAHHATRAMYPNARRVLAGRAYAMVRSEIRPHRAACSGHRIAVTFGGSDPVNATARVLRALPDRPLAVDAILGPGYRDRTSLPIDSRITYHAAPPDPAAIIARCGRAIASAGGTLNELAYLGCPTLAFAIVDDQIIPARALADAGLVAGGRAWDTIDDTSLADEVRAFVDNGSLNASIRAIRSSALATVDGYGSSRILDQIM